MRLRASIFSQVPRSDTVSGAKRAGEMALVGKASLERKIRERLGAIQDALLCPFEPQSPYVLAGSHSIDLTKHFGEIYRVDLSLGS